MAVLSKLTRLRFLSLNCHGINDSIISYLRRIIVDYDIVLLQETWLSEFSCKRLADISPDFVFFHSSAMEEKLRSGILSGRPFGGTAILVRQCFASSISVLPCNNPRITAICCSNRDQQNIVICSVYMPYNDRSVDQIVEYNSTIGSIQALIDSNLGCLFVIGGDFNVARDRYGATGEAVWMFCNHNDLLWLEPESDDIRFTFHNDANLHFSLIDHFLCSSCLSPSTKAVHILADGDNTSDHLAISVSLNVPVDNKVGHCRQGHSFRLKWERADISLYQNTVASQLSRIDLPINALLCQNNCIGHNEILDKYYTDILHCLSTSSKLCIPEVKVGIEKHWWTADLDDLKQECIEATTIWRMAGCPRNGDINSNRIKIKLRYKNAVKEAAREGESQLNDELVNHLCTKNNTGFWKAWRKRFCTKNLKSTSVVNGVSGDDNIIKEFSGYFSQVGQPNTTNADLMYEKRVREYLFEHSGLCNGSARAVEVSLLHECISDLKLHLCLLFTAMMRHSFVPTDFRFGIIKPLLKCKNGDQSDLNMYRGITLTPVLSKLFESVLLGLYSEHLISDPLQFGFKKGSGCNNALFAFVESVKYFTKRDSKIHCAFLDASKAFDKVLINGLLNKLIDRKIPFHFISLLYNWYSNLSCAVVWNTAIGCPFPVTCGVRQGGVLSPFLFAIYVDDVINQLRKCGFGIQIGNMFAGCLLYADDIVLLSGSWYGLQKMINICWLFGILWDIKFNPAKSLVTTFGGPSPISDIKSIEGSVIPVVNRVKYLGCYFSAPSAEVDLSPSLGKFHGSFNNILNVIGHNRDEILAVHLTKTYCLPTVMYGCEAWAGCATAFEIKSLSVAWNNTFRKIFNSCWRESPRSLQFYCGCLPACYLIDQRRLLFWKKMLSSNNVLLRILARLCQLKTVALAAKYGIFQIGSCSVRDVKCGIFSAFRNTVL